jgi:hypothetical protein
MTRGVLLIPLLCILASAAGTKGGVVAWVIQCTGDWQDRTDSGHALPVPCTGNRGELWFPLSRESKLVLTSHKTKQWISVRIARTGETQRFDCDKPGECDPPPLPFARSIPKEESAGVLQAFLNSPGAAYARVRLLLSRSANDESQRVTVDHALVTEGSPISLRDLLRPNTPTGDYLLELCPFDEKNGCPSGSKPLAVKWSPTSAATWPGS